MRERLAGLRSRQSAASPTTGALELLVECNGASFLLWEEARLDAIKRLSKCEDQSERLGALMVINTVHGIQRDELPGILESASEQAKYDPRLPDPRLAELKEWLSSWLKTAEDEIVRYGDEQNAIVDRIGREAAERIGEERASPWLEEIKQQVMEGLRARMKAIADHAGISLDEILAEEGPDPALGEEPREAMDKPADSSPLKTCPDCAEDVKAAARVCRFCGYRFDSPAG